MDKSQYWSWEDEFVGHQTEPIQFELTAEAVEKYARAVEDLNPWYLDDQAAGSAGWGARIAPATAATIWAIHASRATQGPKLGPPGRVHAKQSYEFHRPARVGDVLTTVATTVDKYVRRDRLYTVIESTTTNQDGERVVTARMTGIWPF